MSFDETTDVVLGSYTLLPRETSMLETTILGSYSQGGFETTMQLDSDRPFETTAGFETTDWVAAGRLAFDFETTTLKSSTTPCRRGEGFGLGCKAVVWSLHSLSSRARHMAAALSTLARKSSCCSLQVGSVTLGPALDLMVKARGFTPLTLE
jgi:hypothetical protein